MNWTTDNYSIGWVVVCDLPFGAIWFAPDAYGNVRHFSATAGLNLTLDMQRLAVIGDELKAKRRGERFGDRLSEVRRGFCEQFSAALNDAGLFPVRKEAA